MTETTTQTTMVKLRSSWLYACYAFPIDPADFSPALLTSQIEAHKLGHRYLRDKLQECSFTILTVRNETCNELVNLKNPLWNVWHATPAKIIEDYDDKSMRKRFQAECPSFNRPLANGAPLYMMVRAPFYFRYDFPVERSAHIFNSVKVFTGWTSYHADGLKLFKTYARACWRYAFMHDKQLITATSIVPTEGDNFQIAVSLAASPEALNPFILTADTRAELCPIAPAREAIGDAHLQLECFTVESLPFFDKMFSLHQNEN